MTTNEPDFLNYQKTIESGIELAGEYDFPVVKGIKFKALKNPQLIGFNYATNHATEDKEKKIVHFFLPDYRFQQVWNNPDKYIPIFEQYKAILSPDFSVYTDMPRAMQIFNIYRMAWMSAYYQKQGIKVIPSLTWGAEDTYDFCFDWVPRGSAVCVSSVGCMQNKESTRLFLKGFEKAIEVVEPAQVVLYGKATKEVMDICPDLVRVPSFMEERKSERWS